MICVGPRGAAPPLPQHLFRARTPNGGRQPQGRSEPAPAAPPRGPGAGFGAIRGRARPPPGKRRRPPSWAAEWEARRAPSRQCGRRVMRREEGSAKLSSPRRPATRPSRLPRKPRAAPGPAPPSSRRGTGRAPHRHPLLKSQNFPQLRQLSCAVTVKLPGLPRRPRQLLTFAAQKNNRRPLPGRGGGGYRGGDRGEQPAWQSPPSPGASPLLLGLRAAPAHSPACAPATSCPRVGGARRRAVTPASPPVSTRGARTASWDCTAELPIPLHETNSKAPGRGSQVAKGG